MQQPIAGAATFRYLKQLCTTTLSSGELTSLRGRPMQKIATSGRKWTVCSHNTTHSLCNMLVAQNSPLRLNASKLPCQRAPLESEHRPPRQPAETAQNLEIARNRPSMSTGPVTHTVQNIQTSMQVRRISLIPCCHHVVHLHQGM